MSCYDLDGLSSGDEDGDSDKADDDGKNKFEEAEEDDEDEDLADFIDDASMSVFGEEEEHEDAISTRCSGLVAQLSVGNMTDI